MSHTGINTRSRDQASTDEWLVVLGRHSTTSRLLVFDSADLASGPRSVIRLPVSVPVAAHTMWQPAPIPARRRYRPGLSTEDGVTIKRRLEKSETSHWQLRSRL
ncbi:hypothetical protein [Lentzea indica]|uniref:hypothetical protein n=1 Tax=Lentzea indica TaxID=2604800 RepID=UPI00143A217B|nr:hypothetical protein [Lentzea indica]